MSYVTIITSEQLAPHVGDSEWAIVDCRFALRAPQQGREAYRELHIPGAVYAHLDDDLSGPVVPGTTGRHPLPSIAEFGEFLGRVGIGAGVQVVAYDDAGGAIASRFWWMLRWVGHDAVAVLDGGWQGWRENRLPVKRGVEQRPHRSFAGTPHPEMVADAQDVLSMADEQRVRLFDARSADRFRGENETIDPVAGHIPWARSVPYAKNLDDQGNFQTPALLRGRFTRALEGTPPDRAVMYCGSGVTAAHNLLAMEHAGLTGAKLYPGSWSDWITDSSRPTAKGGAEESQIADH